MFLAAFGLRVDPFLDTADPAFYYEAPSLSHRRRKLHACMAAGRGLAVVVGPIGAGKTALLNAAQNDMLVGGLRRVGLILDPTFEAEIELLQAAGAALAFELPADSSARELKEAFKRELFAAGTNEDGQAALFIDEAQLLDESLFETLRSLLNYALDERKLLSVALSGQPELSSAIARHRNFADRVALWLELEPLSPAEAAELLHHRLRCAGFMSSDSPFDSEALQALWEQSCGLPRRLTALAREAMEAAAERSSRIVAAADVETATKLVAPSGAAIGVVKLRRGRNGAARSLPQRLRAWWKAAT